MTRGRHRRPGRAAAAVALASLVATACGPAVPEWSSVPLPGPGRVVTLTGAPDGVLVGMYDPDAAERATIRVVRADGDVTSVPMRTAWEGAGREAELASVSVAGADVVALGGHRAGAHGNVRWTVWRGTRHGVVEQPQRFETFGGWDAGFLVGVAGSRAGPVILGSWVSHTAGGLDVTVWQQEGRRWVQPADPVRRATTTALPSPGAITGVPQGYVAVGWVTRLAAPVRDEPVLWVAGTASGPWRQVRLPTPSAMPLVRPTAVSCSTTHCAVAARSERAVLVWRVAIRPGGVDGPVPQARQGVADPAMVATTEPMEKAALAVVATDDADLVAYGESGSTRVTAVRDGSADDPSTRAGTPVAMAQGPGSRVLLATTDRAGASHLWSTRP